MKAGPPEAPPDKADSRADRPDHPRRPPSMDSLLSDAAAGELLAAFGREAVKEELRRAIADGSTESSEILSRGRQSLSTRFAPSLRRVINGTGVLLHTNLGRAPLSDAARREIEVVAAGYSSLEYDAPSGERGRRQDHVRDLARDVFGCEDALAVNNNASAVFLALSALARGRRVLISRGELVAIGGSFQVPAILEASGARLAEVGTTNRTTIDDYRRGITPDVALLLTVHPSNYEIRGFTATAPPAEIAALAREAKIPWLHDQGTGSVVDLAEFGVGGEPTVAGCLAEGATLVTFSGDKLLGGPQAGIVAGAAEAMSRLAEHPVARVVRPDKLTFAALHATLAAWKTGRWRDLPIYRAAAAPLDALERRGESIRSRAAASELEVAVVAALALFGGGTSPEKRFASRALALTHRRLSADALAQRLRLFDPPVAGRVEDDRVLLDLRSIAPEEDAIVESALASISAEA
ncbi:MAG: L-seryl-tRNA(Sec) selenium transferase [Thermoanaerobaculia bacterium]